MFQKVCSWPQLQALLLLLRISTNFLNVHQTAENVKVCFLIIEGHKQTLCFLFLDTVYKVYLTCLQCITFIF